VHHGRLEPVPPGFTMMAPTRARPFLRSSLLSWRGKARAALDLVLPRGAARDDESLGSFVVRRFGREVLDVLAQPLVGGIYGAHPDSLSLRATMPRFLDEEKLSRSLILGLRRRARANEHGGRAASGARYGLFASFDHGMQVLIDALVHALPSSALRLDTAAQSLELSEGGVRIGTNDGPLDADAVVFALSSPLIGRLVAPHDAALGEALTAIEHGSSATVALGYDATDFPTSLRGYGFVVPTIERRASVAGTFASRKWANRAPPGRELIRVFLGGPASPPGDASDDALIACARGELRALLGVDTTPAVAVVRRYPRAMPHYTVGHLSRVAGIDARLAKHSRIAIAGNSLRGVGIPDAIASGERAARSVMEGQPDGR
jgi:oxygen-dependent protoporphyrinogen oxidase